MYHIPTTRDYLQTNFSDDMEYQNFLDMIKIEVVINLIQILHQPIILLLYLPVIIIMTK